MDFYIDNSLSIEFAGKNIMFEGANYEQKIPEDDYCRKLEDE